MINQLASLTPKMLSLKMRDDVTCAYSGFSDALYWEDEIPISISREEDELIRSLLRFRTSLIIGTPQADLRHIWEAAKLAFPDWIGFAEFRVTPNSSLSEFYKHESEVYIEQILKQIDL